jgi:PAS domain S-box-containing protein
MTRTAVPLICLDLFEASPDFVTIAPLEGPPLFLNRAFRLAIGLGLDEPVETLLEFRPPGFNEYLDEVILPAARAHGSWSGETDYISHAGDAIRVSEVSVFHVDAMSGAELLATVSRNISARDAATSALREADARTRFALEAARAGVWEADLTTGRVVWSDSMRVVQGFGNEQFGGTLESFLALVHPADRPNVNTTMAAMITEPRDFVLEFRALWPDGTTHWIESHGRVVGDAAGRPHRILAVAQDVTARKTLESQLHQAQKMEAIGQLAGGLAHDFNNLLTAILGYAGLLESSLSPDDPRCADVQEIEKAGQRAALLTRQLLAFSRKQILNPVVLQLNDLVTDLSRMLSRLAGEHVEFGQQLASPLSPIRADASQIEQILVNLVVNARDAMPDGGRLTLATADVELDEGFSRVLGIKPGGYVSLTVTDSGGGMDDETKRRIFEPFFTTKEVGKGTGLGLATVFGIVRQSDGAIAVHSEKGHGASFQLYFPAVAEQPTERVSRAGGVLISGSSRILVVEDDESVRTLVRTVLKRHGHHVVEASPVDAIERVAGGEAFDVVISDVVMPGMSGPLMAKQLSAIRPDLPILFISGFATDVVSQHGVITADTPFLQKPFTGDALLSKVRETIFSRRDASAGVRTDETL